MFSEGLGCSKIFSKKICTAVHILGFVRVNIPPKWYFHEVFASFTTKIARKISNTTFFCTNLSRM